MTFRPKDACIASIDIGSHSARMLVARIDGGTRVRPMAVERRVTRLAGDFDNGQTLKKPGMDRTLSALKEYAGVLKDLGIRSIACGATGVVRRAENGERFLRAIRETTGFQVSILSELAEAYLSAKGSLSVLPPPSHPLLFFDLGGSSTEFLLVDPDSDRPQWETSIFIGAATLTARDLVGDPTDRGSVALARATARQLMAPAISAFHGLEGREASPALPVQVVGTAGTVSTLAAMYLGMESYRPYRINGLVLERQWLDETVDLLIRLPVGARRQLTGLEEGREDIILGGAIIVQEILMGFHRDRLTVTGGGLLEGLLLEMAEHERGWPRRLFSPLTWEIRSD